MVQLQLFPIKPKLDTGLFVDFCVFTGYYQFLHDVIIKLFCFDLQNNIMITLCKKLIKTQQSTNNPMSIFGLIEESMELSQVYLTVSKRYMM
jgi:hypothetical protein